MTSYDETRQIADIWDIEDVQSLRDNLTDAQAMDVLRLVDRTKDATLGITWDTIEACIDELGL